MTLAGYFATMRQGRYQRSEERERSGMGLNDIWRNASREIGFYTKETFDSIPASPGVYGWFYPLRITSYDAESFVGEVNRVLNYDAGVKGSPRLSRDFDFKWLRAAIAVELGPNAFQLGNFKKIWDDATNLPGGFEELRRTVMKASIFMPPLYVGKTSNLRLRCMQHIQGSNGGNDFHNRYQQHASAVGAAARNVADLLFVCIKLGGFEDAAEQPTAGGDLEGLVEHLLKSLAKPPYSRL
jgi:hypothetical protein